MTDTLDILMNKRVSIDTDYILLHFAHVFKNECNERKILHSVVDESWGLSVSYNYVSSGAFYGGERQVRKANAKRNLTRTLVLTEDKNGEHQLFQFWYDSYENSNGYCEIHKQSLFVPYMTVPTYYYNEKLKNIK